MGYNDFMASGILYPYYKYFQGYFEQDTDCNHTPLVNNANISGC